MDWENPDRGGYHGSTRVIYAPAHGPERLPPEDMPEIAHDFGELSGGFAAGHEIFPARSVVPYVIDTFPDTGNYEDNRRADVFTMASIERATGVPIPTISVEDRSKVGLDMPVAWFENTLGRLPDIRLTRHQMLGAARNVQHAAEMAREAGNVLLLQLDTDEGVENAFIFGDAGMAQFWISPEDLAAQRFDRAWATTEGG